MQPVDDSPEGIQTRLDAMNRVLDSTTEYLEQGTTHSRVLPKGKR